jgi:L-fuconolactonase
VQETGLDGTVAVQARQNTAETEWLLALTETYDYIRSVVGWVDLCAPDVRADLGRFAAHPRFVGVRHIVQDEPDDRFMLRPDFLRGLEALAEFDLAYDLLLYPKHLPLGVRSLRLRPAPGLRRPGGGIDDLLAFTQIACLGGSGDAAQPATG